MDLTSATKTSTVTGISNSLLQTRFVLAFDHLPFTPPAVGEAEF